MTAIAIREPFEMTREQIDLLKDSICKGATDTELQMFVQVCNRLQLDPLARQIFAVKRYDGQLRREVMTPTVSIDGLRLVAQRTGTYAGQTEPQWCGRDGAWRTVWLEDEPPAAARVGVLRRGFDAPMYAVARFGAYAQMTREGKLNRMWAQMGDLMIAKCAEALALRKAFPNELSSIYTPDEMGQAETKADVIEISERSASRVESAVKAGRKAKAQKGYTGDAVLDDIESDIAEACDVLTLKLAASRAKALPEGERKQALRKMYNEKLDMLEESGPIDQRTGEFLNDTQKMPAWSGGPHDAQPGDDAYLDQIPPMADLEHEQ